MVVDSNACRVTLARSTQYSVARGDAAMARLKPGKRAGLPDRAFAYVDSAGRRRLPIHDRAHVRNALARFNQVAFEVRVRVGIHSGRPKLTDSGYIGLAGHATARVCSTAHGGQIVVSAATRASVVSSLPIGIRFRSLGQHRLAGLPEAEALFQLQAEGLRASFPRLRTGLRAAAGGRRGVPRMPEVAQLELPDEPV